MAGEGATASVFVWGPNGDVSQVSPEGEGMFYQGCIHPKGEFVIFSGNTIGGPRIWRRDLSNRKLIALTPDTAASIHGVYSWDGNSIAFASDLDDDLSTPTFTVEEMTVSGLPLGTVNANIFVLDTNGGSIHQLTAGDHFDQRPTFSPDGKMITFVRRVKNQGELIPTLWSVSTDGSSDAQQVNIVGNKWAYRPWYAADGERIFYFTIDESERHRIVSIPSGGGTPEIFAPDDEGRSHGPFVDPTGQYLLIHSTRGVGDNHKIWEVPINGGKPKQLAPPGFDISVNVMHATRSDDGVIAFDSF